MSETWVQFTSNFRFRLPDFQGPRCGLLCSPIVIRQKHFWESATSMSFEFAILMPSRGKYGYVELTHRFGTRGMPMYQCSDIGCWQAVKKPPQAAPLRMIAWGEFKKHWTSKEQVLISKNRRGYSRLYTMWGLRLDGQCGQCWCSALRIISIQRKLTCQCIWLTRREKSRAPARPVGSTQTHLPLEWGTEANWRSLSLLFPAGKNGKNGSGLLRRNKIWLPTT